MEKHTDPIGNLFAVITAVILCVSENILTTVKGSNLVFLMVKSQLAQCPFGDYYMKTTATALF